jgi:hypothetical protein
MKWTLEKTRAKLSYSKKSLKTRRTSKESLTVVGTLKTAVDELGQLLK